MLPGPDRCRDAGRFLNSILTATIKKFNEKFKTVKTGTITFVTKRKLTNKGEQICQVLVI
jgi:hypothetical protein